MRMFVCDDVLLMMSRDRDRDVIHGIKKQKTRTNKCLSTRTGSQRMKRKYEVTFLGLCFLFIITKWSNSMCEGFVLQQHTPCALQMGYNGKGAITRFINRRASRGRNVAMMSTGGLNKIIISVAEASMSSRPHATFIAKFSALRISKMIQNPWYIWAILTLTSNVGICSEKTKIGSMLSSPLVTMFCTLVLCNINLLPSSHAAYSMVLKWLVPLAVPLLLLDADLRKCFKSMSSLFKAFLVGSMGSFLGSIIAFKLVPMSSIADSYKVASAICARHIGGAVNFIAISEILNVKSDVVTAAIAADNVVVALYFTFLFALSAPERSGNHENSVWRGNTLQEHATQQVSTSTFTQETGKCPIPMFSAKENGLVEDGITSTINKEDGEEANNKIESESKQNIPLKSSATTTFTPPPQKDVTIEKLLGALSLSFMICAVSQLLTHLTSVPSILMSSVLAVISATIFPSKIAPIAQAGGVVGVIFMQMFFAVTGAMGHIPTVIKTAPVLFVHSFTQIMLHFAIAVSIGRVLKIPFREIALASNANVGGPTTAAAMANSKRWKELVLPALLSGIFGYAVATGLGLGLSVLLRP